MLLQEITASDGARAEKKKAEVQGVKDTLGGREATSIAEDKDIVEEDLLGGEARARRGGERAQAITAKDIGCSRR